ncbi:MAG TPA: iron-sulfur cluster assembly scaffold protein [Desulfomicrobiaceae bacterium]|nr:iron-sulfur cluster assembly scaffold protein [Desulfomicrobiaceae bacterium]
MSESEPSFDFWQDHSDNFLRMALSHERMERVHSPDGYGTRTGECGDTVEFFLSLESGRVKHVAFDIDGCRNTQATANTVAELAEGKSVDQAWQITPEQIAGFLETLPEDHFHCAELAVGAFYLALSSLDKPAGS